jgi:hypothetical protein
MSTEQLLKIKTNTLVDDISSIQDQISNLEIQDKSIKEKIQCLRQTMDEKHEQLKIQQTNHQSIMEEKVTTLQEIETQNSWMQKMEYVQKCWDFMVQRQTRKTKNARKISEDSINQNKPDPVFTGNIKDCKKYTWDTIIAKAHTSHFNGLFKKMCRKHRYPEFEFATLDKLILLSKSSSTYLIGVGHDCGKERCRFPITNDVWIDIQHIQDVLLFPNRFDFSLHTYPKTFFIQRVVSPCKNFDI